MIERLLLRRNSVAVSAVEPSNPPAGELPVLDFSSLVERTGTGHFVHALRAKLGFPPELFESSVRPVVAAFAEFVQLLPASESDHHAEPGGLFIHTMEVVAFALDYRRGQILPKGASPEAISGEAHRWTYAVFVAALLHDVGKPIADLCVYLRKGALARELWVPLAGPVTACGATSYRFEFAPCDSRQSELHSKLPALLFNRFVPASIVDWLSADSALIRELVSCLSGVKAAEEGVLHRLVARADAESVRRNLLGGSRAAVDAHAQARAAGTNATAPAPMQQPAVAPRRLGPGATSQVTDKAPEQALRFMDWLQAGLASGRLRFNESGALVHFVPEGMLLVSPRVFQEFAKVHGENGRATTAGGHAAHPGKGIQRQVLRAGWHLRADKGVNILTYQLVRGGRAVSQLSGVVIERPELFVNPVPPQNALLVRAAPGESAP